MAIPEYLLNELDSIDSTNNYAMKLLDANKAHNGMTVVARNQWAGKGQRGKTWLDADGESLLMSIITVPGRPIQEQFIFSATIAGAVAKFLQNFNNAWRVNIKWPNDIIINDKKAGGILIENVLRGNKWANSVIGLGLNINQQSLPEDLPYAVSLRMASGKEFVISEIRDWIWEGIMKAIEENAEPEKIMGAYNAMLYKRGQMQDFRNNTIVYPARIVMVNEDGTLSMKLEDGIIVNYQHGQVEWVWGG